MKCLLNYSFHYFALLLGIPSRTGGYLQSTYPQEFYLAPVNYLP
jgi:hypothetical protein